MRPGGLCTKAFSAKSSAGERDLEGLCIVPKESLTYTLGGGTAGAVLS
jgi:hypothetical protein